MHLDDFEGAGNLLLATRQVEGLVSVAVSEAESTHGLHSERAAWRGMVWRAGQTCASSLLSLSSSATTFAASVMLAGSRGTLKSNVLNEIGDGNMEL